MEQTLVLIKPDAMGKKIMGEIISIYEKKDFNITHMKIVKASKQMAIDHYIEHKGKSFFPELVEFITSSPVCAIILEADDVVALVRKTNGVTNPLEAEIGSVRGRFAISKSRNAVHASDSLESAKREIAIWFPELS